MPVHKGTLLLKHSQIVVHWTDGKTESVSLVDEITRVGRGKVGNKVAVPDVFQSVSRQHLEIRREKEGYRLVDLGSRNGTLVNGIDIKDTYLKDGDEITIGQNEEGQQIKIVFQMGSEGLLNELASIDEAVTLPPSSGLDSEAPEGVPYFKIRWQNGSTNYYPIEKDRIIIGRGVEADLRVPENLRFVSGQHAEVQKEATGYFIRDLNSTNGTLVNNQSLQPDQDYAIGNESIIRIGDDNYGVSIGFTFYNPSETANSVAGFMQAAQATQVEKISMLLIGRLDNCDVVLDAPEVSRRHAIIRKLGDAYSLEDLDSSNGTYVNDELIKATELHDGDLIQISNFRLLFQGGLLVPYQMSGMRLDASNLTKDVKTRNGMRRILDNIDLSVLPREFIGLVGGSGAGKSTLLNALIGIRRGDGEVKLNGYDFYEEYESFRAQIGYVPQSDILHTSLTVEKALDYAARLRLPWNLSQDERMRRIDMVLDTVSMNTES
ncbi:MAG TPA: FHA domain-containing protein, partial [Anaerolineales bacterium]|nr:FHA domain-containing protein [Anaerolineales bacterium]